MKLYIKSIIAMAALLYLGMGAASAQSSSQEEEEEAVKTTKIIQLDGIANTETAAGKLEISFSGPNDKMEITMTIKATPADGNYITEDFIYLTKTVDGGIAQTRDPNIDTEKIEVTPSEDNGDPSKPTTYTYKISPAEKFIAQSRGASTKGWISTDDETSYFYYDYDVTANFHARKSLKDATVTVTTDKESYTYTGEEIKPVVTVKYGSETLELGTDYEVAYYHNVDAASADPEEGNAPHLVVSGIGKYTDDVTVYFTIDPIPVTVTKAPVAIENLKYDGEEHALITAGETDENGVMMYSLDGETFSRVIPTGKDAEKYTVTYKAAGTSSNYSDSETASVEVTIAKATPSVTAPTAKENLTYTGEAQELINAGSTTGGEIRYSLDDVNYNTSIPTGTEAKEYTVYYKVVGGTNYEDVAAASIKVTISEAKMTVSAKGFEGAYDNDAHGITVSVTTPEEGAVVKYGTTENTYDLTENPTYKEAGTYTVYYQVTKDGYEATTGNATVKISKATPEVTAPTAKENLTYTGEAQELINAGSTTGGEMLYSLDDDTYSTNIPTGTEAKEYTVYYKVVGGTNYEDVAVASIKVTISEAKMTVSAKGFEGAYDNDMHGITVTVTTPAEGAVVKYGTKEDTYDLTENPTYKEAGTYTVYYQVTKDGYETTTGNATVKISKATPEVTAPTAKEGLTYTGEAQELINAGSTTGGELQYSLDDDTYSTNIPTGTEAKEYTVYYKVVGGTNYEDVAAASLQVTISGALVERYPLWINDTQVTADNAEDILGHDKNPEMPLYIYNNKDDKDHILLVNQDLLGTTVIKSGLPELQIYLIEANKIKSIEFNNQGQEGNTGKLTFTCNGNHPGRLVIENTKGNSVITGFSEIDYKWKLTLIEPESAFYDETAHQMMYKDKNNATQVADNVTIGQEIIPTAEKVSLKNPALKIAAIKFNNYSYSPTADPTKSKILITLNPTPSDPEAGDDYVDDDGEPGIVVGSTMKDSQAGHVANQVANNMLVPGGSKFAEDYDGFTFMVPAGSGTIIIDQEVDEGYEFHLRIGTGAPLTLAEGENGRAEAREPYSVTTPTYCYLYLVEKTGAAGTRGTRLGKRTKAHGKLISVQVRATTVIPTTPPSEASGGVIPKSEDPEDPVDPVTPPTGIREVKSEAVKSEKFANRWYTLDGQALQSKPTKAGVYIYNRKKIVIK